MRVTLIALETDLFSFGIRTLSACLRDAGHETRLVFMVPEARLNGAKGERRYSEQLLEHLRALCADSQLIGISLMTNQFLAAIEITRHLKGQGIEAPVLWGGVQPTVEPEECLRYADVVCVGEGEGAIVELTERLANSRGYHDVNNLWLNSADGIVRNPLRPLITDLNTIPLPDYSCAQHYVSVGDQIEELTTERLRFFKGERFKGNGASIPYMTMTSRGCPYSCTYCGNSVYKRLFPGQRLLRWRSDESIIEELKIVQNNIASVSYVYFVDDNFTARSREKLKAFCALYKKEIGLPFFAQVSPLMISEEKMQILFDAGCAHITMGVETAVQRIADMYNRTREHKALPRAIKVVEKYRSSMDPPPTYQFIIDNPYETPAEMAATLRLAASFPRPWRNPIYSLMLFPGVPLFYKAMADGIIKDKTAEIYERDWRKQSNPYFQLWVRLYHANIPPVFLRPLLSPLLVKLMSSKRVSGLLRLVRRN